VEDEEEEEMDQIGREKEECLSETKNVNNQSP
jgi:hypothetical protein